MKDKLSSLGRPRDFAFGARAMEFLQAGGTAEEAHAIVDGAAEQLARRGLSKSAEDQGQAVGAPPRQPTREREAKLETPPKVKEASPPARAPAKHNPPRGLSAIVSANAPTKRANLILFKTSDGRLWGRIGWHELHGMRRDGNVADLILKRVNPPLDQFAMLDQVMTDAQFKELHDAAQKQIATD